MWVKLVPSVEGFKIKTEVSWGGRIQSWGWLWTLSAASAVPSPTWQPALQTLNLSALQIMWTNSLKQISLSTNYWFCFSGEMTKSVFFPPMVKLPWYNTLKIQLIYSEATQSYFSALVPISLPSLPSTFHCLMKENIYFLCTVSSFSLLESQRKKFVFFLIHNMSWKYHFHKRCSPNFNNT